MLKKLFFALLVSSSMLQAEQTLSIIKPDAVANQHIGEIIARFEENKLKIAALKMIKLDKKQASDFYAVHKERPFFGELIETMTAGPVVIIVLDGDNAVVKNREIMGATDPKKAAPNTIRKDFAESITKNAVHGSDSLENAKTEIDFFFKQDDIIKK